MSYGYPTTMRHPRTMRQSGTAYANAVEHHKSNDHSGVAIVLICGAILLASIAKWVIS